MDSTAAPPMLRPRTYSDPELPQLMPLPVRPASSYETRPVVQALPSFTDEVIELMAKRLTINIDEHPEFHWIIFDCLNALLEDGWSCGQRGEDLEFTSNTSGETRSDHELVELHKKMSERLLQAKADFKGKLKEPYFLIRRLVFMAIMGEKDVRGVCTPKLVNEAMQLLQIDIKQEIYLVRRVKYTIEDSYYRMKKVGAHQITIQNCIDVESLVVNLELDRAGFLKKISPSGLLYCVECRTAMGDVISTGCHDVLCNACAVETHSTGHRQDHPLVFIEQSACSECTRKCSVVRCQDCVDLFCYDCFRELHQRGKRQRHCVSLPQRTFCFECDAKEAAYICVECEDALCPRCSSHIHRQGARQNHTLFGLRKAAYNKKLFANNLDRLMGIVQKNLETSYSFNSWYLFYDRAMAPFWYDFNTGTNIRADPKNLSKPPVEAAGQDLETPASQLEPEEQLNRGLPGTQSVTDTVYAKYASESAVFDVPPPLNIRFASPVTMTMGSGGQGIRGFGGTAGGAEGDAAPAPARPLSG